MRRHFASSRPGGTRISRVPFAFLLAVVLAPQWEAAHAADESVVYEIHRGVDLGLPGETPQKDYYVNLGSDQGIKIGSVLEVLRKQATHDVVNSKYYQDALFPIARLKVIHSEKHLAIARLEKLLPPEETPSLSPRAVMMGDRVRPAK